MKTIEQLVDDVRAIIDATRAGKARTLGNWSVPQILQHLGKWIQFSFDGFPYRYPWMMRLFATPLKWLAFETLYRMAMKPGFRNPKSVAAGEPDPDVTLDTAAELITSQLDRILAGEQMNATNPMVGSFRHDQYVFVHLRHAELHLSFVRIE